MPSPSRPVYDDQRSSHTFRNIPYAYSPTKEKIVSSVAISQVLDGSKTNDLKSDKFEQAVCLQFVPSFVPHSYSPEGRKKGASFPFVPPLSGRQPALPSVRPSISWEGGREGGRGQTRSNLS